MCVLPLAKVLHVVLLDLPQCLHIVVFRGLFNGGK